MEASLAVLSWSTLVAGTLLLADRIPSQRAPVPIAVLGLLSLATAFELARYDHGAAGAFLAVAHVAAPVVAIFAGALWGSRRFYGWPDLGAHPGRAALLAAAVLLGVLAGTNAWPRDLEESQRRAMALREEVLAWREQHAGVWPPRLEDAAADVPRSRMGWTDPPPFRYRADAPAGAEIAFALSGGRERVLHLVEGRWDTRNR